MIKRIYVFFILITAAPLLCVRTAGNEWNHICTADCVGFHSKTSRFASSWSACFCSHVHAVHAYVLGLICQDHRQAPWVCEVFPSCISPCLGSPRPLIIPTLTLISLPLSLSHTHTRSLSSLLSHSACVSPALPLCDLSVYVWPFCRSAPANDGTGIAGVLH